MIHLVQLLCPSRHCVMAGFYDPAKTRERPAEDDLRLKFKECVEAGLLNPWCGICGSRDLHSEERSTAFANMEEAERVGREMEREQLRIAALFAAGRNWRGGKLWCALPLWPQDSPAVRRLLAEVEFESCNPADALASLSDPHTPPKQEEVKP